MSSVPRTRRRDPLSREGAATEVAAREVRGQLHFRGTGSAALLVAEGRVEFGQETRQVVHLLGAVRQQIATAGYRVAE